MLITLCQIFRILTFYEGIKFDEIDVAENKPRFLVNNRPAIVNLLRVRSLDFCLPLSIS